MFRFILLLPVKNSVTILLIFLFKIKPILLSPVKNIVTILLIFFSNSSPVGECWPSAADFTKLYATAFKSSLATFKHVLDNFPYGATTFSLHFTKRDISLIRLIRYSIISYRMKKWWRYTETFPMFCFNTLKMFCYLPFS